ncbi:MAG: hypothetical protein LBE38_09360 [Deltaproteobacteria bacterium]|jgi:hypothetical protein|nr:hypothetical protein [Deltaproteobacteria bacterium]
MPSFNITKVELHNPEELFDKLKSVSMLTDPLSKPYENAHITLKKLHFSDIRPTQRYVLSDNLKCVHHLAWELEKHNYDLMNLSGYLRIWTDLEPDTPRDVLPPILERSVEADGSHLNIVNDGMHRLYACRMEWKVPQVILVENLPKEFPYYAYPLPGPFPWDSVEILQGCEIPDSFIKKWHRTRDNKRLYRNFNSSFQNVGAPRGGGQEK